MKMQDLLISICKYLFFKEKNSFFLRERALKCNYLVFIFPWHGADWEPVALTFILKLFHNLLKLIFLTPCCLYGHEIA